MNKIDLPKVDKAAHYRPFMEVIGKSPFKAIEAHMDIVIQCVERLGVMYDHYLKREFEQAEALWTGIQDLEHEADKVKNTIRDKTPKSFFMPVSQSDLSHFLHLLDRIADASEDVSDLLASRRTEVPPEIAELFREHWSYVWKAAEWLEKAIDLVEPLLDSAFRGKEKAKIQEHLHVVSDMEWKADDVKRVLRKKIYGLEGQVSDLSIYHMLKILRLVDDIANTAETAEGGLRTIVSR